MAKRGKKALYRELLNAAARYFKTCEASGYNRALFGLIQFGSEGRLDRILPVCVADHAWSGAAHRAGRADADLESGRDRRLPADRRRRGRTAEKIWKKKKMNKEKIADPE